MEKASLVSSYHKIFNELKKIRFLIAASRTSFLRLAPALHFGLTFERGKLLTRCAKCNGEVERKCTPEVRVRDRPITSVRFDVL